MGKKTQYKAILQGIKYYPEGASLENIQEGLVPSIPRRTLQRYLAFLVAEDQLHTYGKARATKYCLPSQTGRTPQQIDLIPLSSAGHSIQKQTGQPIQKRIPVGYNHKFLDQYRPNETHYLSESLRKHLFSLGQSPNPERPAGTYARQIYNRLLIDLSWNSSRLEGNTYSLLETERLLSLGEAANGKESQEAQMILNHKSAIEFLIDTAELIQFDRFTILNLHALLSDNLLHDQRACGSLRIAPIGIAKSIYQPLVVPQLIDEYFQQILDTAAAIADPFEQSFFVMVHLPYLQPFLDVNKRVSRLAANISLIRSNLCPLSFVDVPSSNYINGLLGIYELNRIELLRDVFVWAYERSSSLYSATRQELGEPDRFRLKYRTTLIALIGEIIRGCLDKSKAIVAIKQKALQVIPSEDQSKFIELVETELLSLHSGNIARFRLKAAEHALWLKNWQ